MSYHKPTAYVSQTPSVTSAFPQREFTDTTVYFSYRSHLDCVVGTGVVSGGVTLRPLPSLTGDREPLSLVPQSEDEDAALGCSTSCEGTGEEDTVV